MHRLRGFDYKRPFFYMVTLKRLTELAAFSQISDEAEPQGWCRTGPPPQNGPAPQNGEREARVLRGRPRPPPSPLSLSGLGMIGL